MAITMGAQEVANTLRPHLALQHLDPHDLHQLNFLKDVAAHLGLDHTPEVLTHIAGLMREHDLVIHSGQEYPKMVARKADGKSFEAKDEEDEDRIVNEVPEELRKPPEPARLELPGDNAQARDVLEQDHVADDGTSTDLSRRVPRQVPVDDKSSLGRRTDREAAQGQRPLQSNHDRVGDHAVVDDKSGLHADHFAEQEPGAAAMRQGVADFDDAVEDDKPTHDQPAAKPTVDLSRRPK